MRPVRLTKPQGFRTAPGLVQVYERGKLFYKRFFPAGGRFNLPVGDYMIDGNVREIPFVRYARPALPPYERNKRFEGGQRTVIQMPNPNKCSTIPEQGIVVIDPSIAKSDRAVLTFILAHEMGHQYYGTEWKCDRFATNMLLDMGFNPSQIAIASARSLSDRNAGRICKVSSYNAQIRQI